VLKERVLQTDLVRSTLLCANHQTPHRFLDFIAVLLHFVLALDCRLVISLRTEIFKRQLHNNAKQTRLLNEGIKFFEFLMVL
jgi:hypothetical protein